MKIQNHTSYKSGRLLAAAVAFAITANIHAAQSDTIPTSLLIESHDITSLSAWGPYSKRYAGISHIHDMNSGLRFDFSVMPGYYRNRQFVPHVLFESAYHPWNISPQLDHITYRYEMEWKDRVYTDVTYHVLDSARTLVEMECVNNTDLNQNLVLNLMSYIDFEDEQPRISLSTRDGAIWINATEYAENEPVHRSPAYNLVYDGARRGEIRHSGNVSGFALGNVSATPGQRISYEFDIPHEMKQGTIGFRYAVKGDSPAILALSGISNDTLRLSPSDGFAIATIPFESQTTGRHRLTLTAINKANCTLDGLFIAPTDHAVSFEQRNVNFSPELIRGKESCDYIVKYPVSSPYYGVAWNFEDSEIREILDDNLESFFRKKTHDHVSSRLHGNGRWHYTDAFLRPIVVSPHSSRKISAIIASGTLQDVENEIRRFHTSPELYMPPVPATITSTLPAGMPYANSIRLLQASLLSNIVYPVHTQGQYIRHFTPGKNWNSLYTWDSGFIAIGLTDIDIAKAFECLRAYTTAPGSESAFIHHGTPLPIQIYALQEIWNRNPSQEILRFIYPRLKQFYDFMAGNAPTSTTRMKGSGLLRTWDYFYNSGGWDDYPPQIAPSDKSTVTPVVSTAYYIRAAKILRHFAERLGEKQHVKAYDRDISRMANALQAYSWDSNCGYYSYVVHDKDTKPIGIMRYDDGSNFNMGLDGVSPLIANISSAAQTDTMISHIFDKSRLWTDAGISTVDQSAPYFKHDGYWNGTVWFPHQWLIWKSMLDYARPDDAFRIASTALDIWERECSESYFTFEHFIIESGRGAGWHQFSGLSSPLLNWHASYYRPGKISTGFEVFVDSHRFDEQLSALDADISFDTSVKPHQRTILVCLNPDNKYTVTLNGKSLEARQRHPGLVEITLPASNHPACLKVRPVI